MEIFVVRLNPDPRKGIAYSKYPTRQEYEDIHTSAVMDGFHEAVNFLPEQGVTRGYLPPKHLKAMRTGNPFTLITITAKTAKSGGDMLVGIQGGCIYEREHKRKNINGEELLWHYSCPTSQSLLLSNPLPNARELILGNGEKWVRGPTHEISPNTFKQIAEALKIQVQNGEKGKLDNILNPPKSSTTLDVILASNFDNQVDSALKAPNLVILGNPNPTQVRVHSYQYQRDPRVVAYALQQAKGICGDCKQSAPFSRRSNGNPYLEVHHIKMLKDGGRDTPDNVIALCPNCHRKRHLG